METHSKKITGLDLHKPGVYEGFVKFRADNHMPIPPSRHIGQAGHHWLHERRDLSGSADQGSWMVAQWSPSELVWYHSNAVATNAKPLNGTGMMSHWEWAGHVPLPDIPE